ncbi:MAG: hypothetical protein A3C85_01050 [Candidatus Doudnabacteria bacterium RIFCSPHIGHO2_02_FULL_48_21]|uniref:Glycosyltransferase 2-like domain-containing protein n=1 Tax=Candidatus Doudnabacteria bacterium RIFCSPLOWO2_02_FULL_48_13 TaxID=1817845 RepID=A0A1F5Q902_9BACT|nr:MAG: hypothetical protein A3K05_04100 [Candidatus Doudnabacteria bacterium RIFCSPHIGHO2_01_48_18]OGE77243.1 MAG: hypothetical protein A2668_03105 [Candidatus Doudnabacteria bacterium RIFCSPHIGHO2_01_FULL_48_180]OGE91075.1 MAG: hypothetical protein A3F44_01990 [Candidatus Doudnabacteria bacterium RIFCSPHIGHO2_12_FULL_47_25]OGE93765.1 MAG: hypothetical protein A3C85_01050 [Candidatus Doudnabacteria bacterium RIFCSPHIGHO2_02_FULL_48_21]OGE97166.1 MAG: hypothetical protein A3A83_01030 [Candidatu
METSNNNQTQTDQPLVSVNILSYNSMRYIEGCLDTALAQTYKNLEILVIITGSEDGSAEFIKQKYGRQKRVKIIEPGVNLWFSRGHNLGIKMCQGKYALVLNQDTVMEKDFVVKLARVMEQDQSLGSVSGKLLHYNFSFNSKTKILDSTGIEIFKTRRVIDRGQWEKDDHQYDADTEIFGASGAAAFYRRSALEAVKLPKRNSEFEYYDEDFIAYKEDIDLSWRLQLAGYRCKYIPEAILYHGRTVGRSWPNQLVRFIVNRKRQPRLYRKMAFKNHYLMMIKCELRTHFWHQFGFIFVRESLLLIYTLIFEPFQFAVVSMLYRELPEAWRKRKLIMANVKTDPQRIWKLFH